MLPAGICCNYAKFSWDKWFYTVWQCFVWVCMVHTWYILCVLHTRFLMQTDYFLCACSQDMIEHAELRQNKNPGDTLVINTYAYTIKIKSPFGWNVPVWTLRKSPSVYSGVAPVLFCLCLVLDFFVLSQPQ